MKKKTKNTMTKGDIQAAENARRVWLDKKQSLGLTQAKLAELLGSTQGAVSNWLNGYTAIGTNALLKISAILNVDPQEIRPEFEYGAFSDDLSQDTIRIAQKLETLPEGVRSDIERTIDSIIDSNYADFIRQATAPTKKRRAVPAPNPSIITSKKGAGKTMKMQLTDKYKK